MAVIPQELMDAFDTATTSIFRLELLQHYADDTDFHQHQAGEQWRDTGPKQHWCDLVRRRTTDGVRMQRVHVVTHPLTEYMRFELGASYPLNVEAGEDVRILLGPMPELARALDFWMFDEQTVWRMDYDWDGCLVGVSRFEDVELAVAWKHTALALSSPLITAHATL